MATQQEVVEHFHNLMTDDEMRQALDHLRALGCSIQRDHPSDDPYNARYWHIDVGDPSWTGPLDPPKLSFYYHNRDDDMWEWLE